MQDVSSVILASFGLLPGSTSLVLCAYKPGTWFGAGCGILMWLRQRGRLGASSGKARTPVARRVVTVSSRSIELALIYRGRGRGMG